MKITFWIFLSLIVYCYLGYPFLISILSKVIPRPVKKSSIFPEVSIVISVYNEEDVIARKINNLLSLDYPSEKIEILIGSDGSVDQTNKIVSNFSDPRVRLIAHGQRRGKMATLKELVDMAKGEIIVFNDARQILEKDAIKNLVENFADRKVGCVSGELIFSQKEGETAQGINLYWEYEKFMRRHESQIHSMLGATGAIYAVRKELFTPGPDNVILDDVFIPFKIIEKGFRAVFDGTAYAYDKAAQDPKEEYRRKARTLYGNYQIFFLFPDLFNPLASPIAIQFFSHKFLRVIVPFLMIALVPLNFFILDEKIYQIAFAAQILFYAAAITGALAKSQKCDILTPVAKFCYVPYVFCLLNFSALIGFYRFIRAKQEITWQKARG